MTAKPYVHLQGAGQEVTIITSTATSGDWPPTASTLMLAAHVSLRDLTVGNAGTGLHSVALLATDGTTQTLVADVTAWAQRGGGTSNYGIFLTGNSTGVTLQHVTALGENGSENYGLYNRSGAEATLHSGTFTGRGGNSGRGIYNVDSGTTLEADGVTALGGNGSNANYGLANISSAKAVLRGVSLTGRGGTSTYGILNNNAALDTESITVLAVNGTYCYGLYNSVGASAMLHGSSFTARDGTNSAYGIYNQDSSTTLEAESVTGLAENSSGSNVGLYNTLSATVTLYSGVFAGREGAYTRGIYNNAALTAQGIVALAENGGTNNFGLYNDGAGAATLRGGTFTGRGGSYARGIYNRFSGTTLEAENVAALGENGTESSGLHNSQVATATLRGGSFTGRGGEDAYGIYNNGSGTTLEAGSVIALGEGGATYSAGLYNWSGTASATQSVLKCSAGRPAHGIGGSTIVSNSRLEGGAALGVTCVLVTQGTNISTDGSTCPGP